MITLFACIVNVEIALNLSDLFVVTVLSPPWECSFLNFALVFRISGGKGVCICAKN